LPCLQRFAVGRLASTFTVPYGSYYSWCYGTCTIYFVNLDTCDYTACYSEVVSANLPSKLCLIQQLITAMRCLPSNRRTAVTPRRRSVLTKSMEAMEDMEDIVMAGNMVRSTKSCKSNKSNGKPLYTLTHTLVLELGGTTTTRTTNGIGSRVFVWSSSGFLKDLFFLVVGSAERWCRTFV
jgi:hypothetical protein